MSNSVQFDRHFRLRRKTAKLQKSTGGESPKATHLQPKFPHNSQIYELARWSTSVALAQEDLRPSVYPFRLPQHNQI